MPIARFPLVVLFGILGIISSASADRVETKGSERVYQTGRIRLFYHVEGVHAVDLVDQNGNSVPDQVEDVATQTQAAYKLFVQVLGFPDPFESERFRAASFLDIQFRHKDVLRTSGAAYDELQRFRRPMDPPGTQSICFNVATSVKAPANLTPAHELFHLIQYSVTYFKNRWFTEGTARWSERALGTGGIGRIIGKVSLPLTADAQSQLSAMAYDAAYRFWNPLAMQYNPEAAIPETPATAELAKLTYVDGTAVMKDLNLSGWRLVREVLRNLGDADKQAFRELGYDRWSEKNQRSASNDPYIMNAILQVTQSR